MHGDLKGYAVSASLAWTPTIGLMVAMIIIISLLLLLLLLPLSLYVAHSSGDLRWGQLSTQWLAGPAQAGICARASSTSLIWVHSTSEELQVAVAAKDLRGWRAGFSR